MKVQTSSFEFRSSHVGSGSHCRSGSLAGGCIHLLRLQKVLWEKEEAEESAWEEGRPTQEREGRRRRGWGKGAWLLIGFRSTAWLTWCSGAVCLAGGRGEEGGWGRRERAGEAGQARVHVGLQLHRCPGRFSVTMEKTQVLYSVAHWWL